MNDHLAFRQAILNSPLDDAPSWIYADWLEEQNELDRANLIRTQLQCESMSPGDPERIALEVMAQRLLAKNSETWRPESLAYNHISTLGSDRSGGLMRSATVVVATDSDAARALTFLQTHGHVRSLTLNVRHAQALQRLVRSPLLKQIRDLTIVQPYDELVHTLLTRAGWENLACLSCPIPLHMVTTARAWLDELSFPHLTRLHLRGHSKSPNAGGGSKPSQTQVIPSLLESKAINNLRHLQLSDFRFEPRLFQNFVGSSAISGLESFELLNCVCPNVATVLAYWSNMSHLKTLRLVNCEVPDVDGICLAQSNRFPHLETLDLSENRIGDEGMAALASSALLPQLSWLSLQHNFTRFQHLAHFQRYSAKSQLRYLCADGNLSDPNTADVIDQWPIFDQLRALEFSCTSPLHNDLSLLADNPCFSRLKKLRIRFPQLDENQINCLVQSPHLKSLIWLELDLGTRYGLRENTVNAINARFRDSYCNLL